MGKQGILLHFAPLCYYYNTYFVKKQVFFQKKLKNIFSFIKSAKSLKKLFQKIEKCGTILLAARQRVYKACGYHGGETMSFFKKLFGIGKNPESTAYKIDMAKSIHGQAVKYVTERRDGGEDVIGRGGSVSFVDNRVIVDSSGDRLFISEVKNTDISWLMSGNGVIITGKNILEGGKERSITVHFVYYRK